jgi:hypothetical protein
MKSFSRNRSGKILNQYRIKIYERSSNASNHWGRTPALRDVKNCQDRNVIAFGKDDGVHGFKGSGVQSSILFPGLHLGCIFTAKASSSSGIIQNLEPNWQLLGKMSLFKEALGSSVPSLSLTLNVEP